MRRSSSKSHRSLASRSTKPTAIDLFSGCGGLTLGLKRAAFHVVAAVEYEQKARETYRLNHPEVRVYGTDIRTLEPGSMMKELGIVRGELDLIAGCPPCQGFSRLRTRNTKPAMNDAQNDLVFEFLRFVRAFEPKSILLENVPALYHDDRFVLMCDELLSLGYSLDAAVLDAADYGIPQRRKRLILIGSRIVTPRLGTKARTKATVRHAFSELSEHVLQTDPLHLLPERRSNAVREVISQIPRDGGSRRQLSPALQLRCHEKTNGFRDVYGRMAWESVSPTITSGCSNPSKGRFLHPELNRTITLREAAVLQGFPESYRFDIAHGKEAIALMIGNAIPANFVAVHARFLRSK